MIVSHTHKFIFIKTRKTASTSMEIALSSICGEKDIITPISEVDEKIRIGLGYRSSQNYHLPLYKYSLWDFFKLVIKGKRLIFQRHMAAKDIKKLIGNKIWDSYYKFCLERNPFDKVVSLYYWRNKSSTKSLTISEYIATNNLKYICAFDQYSINNIVAVDQVFKFEQLLEATKKISEKLNLNPPLVMPEYRAKSTHRKDKRHYSNILNRNDIEIIEKKFVREMNLFNYNF